MFEIKILTQFLIFKINSGSLSLTSIDGVNAFDKTMLRAVGRLCPLLQEASFFSFPIIRSFSGIYFSFPNKDGYSRGYSPDSTSPDELETFLNEWPKVFFFYLLICGNTLLNHY